MMFNKIIAQRFSEIIDAGAVPVQEPVTVHLVVPEAAPFAQSGGLGEVGQGLPKALARLGVKVNVYLPKHTGILEEAVIRDLNPRFISQGLKLLTADNRQELEARIFQFPFIPKELGIRTQIIDSVGYDLFGDRRYQQLYAHPDDGLRFYFFNLVAANMIEPGPHSIVHTHDWQAGHVPTLLKTRFVGKNLPVLYTIHNLEYTYQMSLDAFYRMTKIKEVDHPGLYSEQGIKPPGADNADPMWAAIRIADHVNTVSQQYVFETQTPQYGIGYENLLSERYDEGRYTGIVNGVDEAWYPHFDAESVLVEKPEEKRKLQRAFGLEQDPDAMLLMMAARLDNQKGHELLIGIFERLVREAHMNIQFVTTADLSKNGGQSIYDSLQYFAYNPDSPLKGKVSVISPYNKQLTRLVYRGADVSLVPSRYEPCGLVAPCSMVNGTVPIVRKTGGMMNIVSQGHNGFFFEGDWYRYPGDTNYRRLTDNLYRTLVDVYKRFQQKESWSMFIRTMMNEDHSWNSAAAEYVELYQMIIDRFRQSGHYRAFGHF